MSEAFQTAPQTPTVDCCMSCAPAFAQVRSELAQARARADEMEKRLAGRINVLGMVQTRYNAACDLLRSLGYEPPNVDLAQVMKSTWDRWEGGPK